MCVFDQKQNVIQPADVRATLNNRATGADDGSVVLINLMNSFATERRPTVVRYMRRVLKHLASQWLGFTSSDGTLKQTHKVCISIIGRRRSFILHWLNSIPFIAVGLPLTYLNTSTHKRYFSIAISIYFVQNYNNTCSDTWTGQLSIYHALTVAHSKLTVIKITYTITHYTTHNTKH